MGRGGLNAAWFPVAKLYRARAVHNCEELATPADRPGSQLSGFQRYVRETLTGGTEMCVSCGCGRFEDSHGDERNITVSSLQRAAAASERTVEDVLRSLETGSRQMLSSGIPERQSSGQAVESRLHPD